MSTYTWNEIIHQDQELRKTYEEMEKFEISAEEKDIYVFTGCGTSYYLAHTAARYFQKVTGKTAIAVPASEIFMDESSVFSSDHSYQLIAVSRSGTTSEIVKALEYVQDFDYINSLVITCNLQSESVELSQNAIVLDFINEKSVVMTQSFSNMLYALQLYASKVGGQQKVTDDLSMVPSLTKKVLENTEILKPLAENEGYKRYIFLGSSIMHGIAKEATLKLKEMTQTECESYSNLEFRHGPISIVDQSTVVVLLSSDASQNYDDTLISDIQKYGGKVVVFTKEGSSLKGDITVTIPTKYSTNEAAVVYLPHLQLLAYHKAIALGLNPDKPKNLSQVVRLKF